MNICVSCTDGLSKAGENDINVAFSSVETEIDTYKEINPKQLFNVIDYRGNISNLSCCISQCPKPLTDLGLYGAINGNTIKVGCYRSNGEIEVCDLSKVLISSKAEYSWTRSCTKQYEVCNDKDENPTSSYCLSDWADDCNCICLKTYREGYDNLKGVCGVVIPNKECLITCCFSKECGDTICYRYINEIFYPRTVYPFIYHHQVVMSRCDANRQWCGDWNFEEENCENCPDLCYCNDFVDPNNCCPAFTILKTVCYCCICCYKDPYSDEDVCVPLKETPEDQVIVIHPYLMNLSCEKCGDVWVINDKFYGGLLNNSGYQYCAKSSLNCCTCYSCNGFWAEDSIRTKITTTEINCEDSGYDKKTIFKTCVDYNPNTEYAICFEGSRIACRPAEADEDYSKLYCNIPFDEEAYKEYCKNMLSIPFIDGFTSNKLGEWIVRSDHLHEYKSDCFNFWQCVNAVKRQSIQYCVVRYNNCYCNFSNCCFEIKAYYR